MKESEQEALRQRFIFLCAELKKRNIRQAEIARRLKVQRQTVNGILRRGENVSARTVDLLERVARDIENGTSEAGMAHEEPVPYRTSPLISNEYMVGRVIDALKDEAVPIPDRAAAVKPLIDELADRRVVAAAETGAVLALREVRGQSHGRGGKAASPSGGKSGPG